MAARTQSRRGRPQRLLAGLDERFNVGAPVRQALNQVFPDHWSFALGEVALYCFAVLIITGTYLTFFFQPSDHRVLYEGRYVPLKDISMSEAYESTLRISFDVRGGLLIRQLHHWAALLFLAVVVLHLARTFFSGAFRKPRELTWLIGVTMLVVSLLEGFTGYTLPDDVLSGASLRIAYSVLLSIPVVGTWLIFMILGGPYPGPLLLPHLYIAHVLLIPALLIALLGAHLALVVRQRHTVRPGAPARQIPGDRAFPVYAARSAGRFAIVAGVLGGLAGLAQINPIWLYGPYTPSAVQSNSQSDWYFFFLEGSLRLWPPWEIRAFGHMVPAVFFPGVVLPFLVFTLTASYPWLERRFTHDHRMHHVLQRPRDAPIRSAIGAAGFTFWAVLELSAIDDMATLQFGLAIEPVVWTLRVLVLAGPVLAGYLTYRTCVARRHRIRPPDGGRYVRDAHGDYVDSPSADTVAAEPATQRVTTPG